MIVTMLCLQVASPRVPLSLFGEYQGSIWLWLSLSFTTSVALTRSCSQSSLPALRTLIHISIPKNCMFDSTPLPASH